MFKQEIHNPQGLSESFNSICIHFLQYAYSEMWFIQSSSFKYSFYKSSIFIQMKKRFVWDFKVCKQALHNP